jgi:hypothetical protein
MNSIGPFQCTYQTVKVWQTTLMTNYRVLNVSVKRI